VIQRPCWDKAICIPGERSLERSRFESTVSSRNLFKDRIINCVLVEQFDKVVLVKKSYLREDHWISRD